MTTRLAFLATAAILLAGPTASRAATWTIQPDVDGTEVVFHSKAPMESFDGRTRLVTGTVTLDPQRLDAITLVVEVDMASLDTGISLRNGHMRDNHLHTDEFPTGKFTGGEILEGGGSGLGAGGARRLTVQGDLTLHGVTREVQVPLDLELGADGSLALRTEFPVTLSDYGIPRPGFLMMKLGETQRVEVKLWAPAPDRATAQP